MAYGEDDGKKSVFNAGIAQTERIDALQRAINAARFNPLLMNPETNTFNYQIMISSLDGLLQECWAKLTENEKTKIERISYIISEYAKSKPPVSSGVGKNSNQSMIINSNLEGLMALLLIYEKNIKELLDSHNLNAPNAEEEGYF